MSFVFSYNPSDSDLPSTSSHASTSHLHNQLTAVVPPVPPLYHAGLGARSQSRFDGEDDLVPSYGPTTSRRGRMRFVPASDGGLGVLPATGGAGKTEDGREKGKERAVEIEAGEGEEVKQDDEAEKEKEETPAPPLPPSKKLPGSSVRGLYESIVGFKLQQSAPASLRASPAPPPAAAKALFRPALSEPPDRAGSVDIKQEEEDDEDVLVLSSDEEEEAPVPKETKPRRIAKPPPPPQPEDDDDDLIVLDPTTGLPLPALSSSSTSTTSPSPTPPPPPRSFSYNPPPSSSRVRPLLIHQLLPSPSSAAIKLPTHYALKPDNPGWRMLQKQGWKEGAPLGLDGAVPPPAPPAAPSHSSTPSANAQPPLPPRGLLVPLRPTPKNDRLGLGSVGTTKDALRRLTPAERERERLKREAEEKREREKRGRGARGMERVRKGEERERKAWIAYMNR